MKKLALLFGLLFATSAYAADNAVIVTPGVGVTMKSKDIGAGVQAMQPILSDASGNVLLTTLGADAVSNTLTGIPVYSRQLFFNGTTWDRWQGAVTLSSGTLTNLSQLGGQAISMGTGVRAAGTQRVTIATDDVVPASQSGTWNITNISGTVSLPTGAATSAAQTTAQTSLSAIAASTASIDTKASLALPAQANTTTNVGMVTHSVAANGGATPTGNIAANNTTAVVVKASAGTLYGVQMAGIGSAPAYLKIYNATSATCGSGTPVKRLMIPAASTAANGAGSNITFGVAGVNFSTGITYCITTGITDADTTAPAASTFLVNLDWN